MPNQLIPSPPFPPEEPQQRIHALRNHEAARVLLRELLPMVKVP